MMPRVPVEDERRIGLVSKALPCNSPLMGTNPLGFLDIVLINHILQVLISDMT